MSLPNPWVLLALVLSFLGVGFYEHHRGDAEATERVTLAWAKSDALATEQRAKRIAGNDALMKANQKVVDDERKEKAALIERLRSDLTSALISLRNRPARPPEGKPGAAPVAAEPGPNRGCTGAELYRDDAEFLTREADRAQRIRAQRDEYGLLYRKAQETVSALQCQ